MIYPTTSRCDKCHTPTNSDDLTVVVCAGGSEMLECPSCHVATMAAWEEIKAMVAADAALTEGQ